MKILLTTMLLSATMISAAATNADLNFENDKDKDGKGKQSKKSTTVRNFHSVNQWNINIIYKNGERISKTIIVNESTDKSALEIAFEEAEKYLKKPKKVKDFSVTPVSKNSYVLLAGGE